MNSPPAKKKYSPHTKWPQTDLLDTTRAHLKNELLSQRTPAGNWEGRLSSSALSTATALTALALVDQDRYQTLIRNGLAWLATHQNHDGGWGDTDKSISNISTTTLCWAAMAHGHHATENLKKSESRAEKWLVENTGGLSPLHLEKAITARYGKDRTFSVPILTMCALSGRLGSGKAAWGHVKQLPFELAALPRQLFSWMNLNVVSYALPALIAIGLVRHHHLPAQNPVTRLARIVVRDRVLKLLTKIQPASGGFLEATPLTSFVVMSLAAAGYKNHEVTSKGTKFLIRSVSDDGSWPIDSNLATWVTTLSVNALYQNPEFKNEITLSERENLLNWILNQQFQTVHPYTGTLSGGWAWTDLSGGVPDADDTSGALIALHHLNQHDVRAIQAAQKGITWLVNLQNKNGGIPTFCRGWGKLSFDESAPDLTAHALMACYIWLYALPGKLQARTRNAIRRGIYYLFKTQKRDGALTPLWFGNQYSTNEENLTYGTARVVMLLQPLIEQSYINIAQIQSRGYIWLLLAQNSDGGWGGDKNVVSTIEETSLAVSALAAYQSDMHVWTQGKTSKYPLCNAISLDRQFSALSRGVHWLTDHTQAGLEVEPSPIGLYFARLWYYEKLYPWIFSLDALNRIKKHAGMN